MKISMIKSAILAFAPMALFALASCSTTIPGEQNTVVKKSATGTTVVQTFKATATVTSIDKANRKLTFTMSDGNRKTVTCGPEVVNFYSIQVHDQVKITMIDELAVYLDKGKTMGSSDAMTVGLTPLGAKPGVVTADTTRAVVKVTAIDTAGRKVTIESKDGVSKTLMVGDHIDLTKVKVGDTVTIRRTDAMAILVETP